MLTDKIQVVLQATTFDEKELRSMDHNRLAMIMDQAVNRSIYHRIDNPDYAIGQPWLSVERNGEPLADNAAAIRLIWNIYRETVEAKLRSH